MDIIKVQQITKDWAMTDGRRQRISENRLTVADINHIEKTIMNERLQKIKHEMELLVPVFQEASMRMIELEQSGETEVDLEYTKNLVNDLATFFVELSDMVSDYGLTEVTATA